MIIILPSLSFDNLGFFVTEGWTLIDVDAQNLTKEQCDERLSEYIQNGVTANRLRAVYDVGQEQ